MDIGEREQGQKFTLKDNLGESQGVPQMWRNESDAKTLVGRKGGLHRFMQQEQCADPAKYTSAPFFP